MPTAPSENTMSRTVSSPRFFATTPSSPMPRNAPAAGGVRPHMRGNKRISLADTRGFCGTFPHMPVYRMGRVAQLLGVSPDTARRWADSGRLPTSRDDHGHRVVEGAALAAFAVSLAEESGAGVPDS